MAELSPEKSYKLSSLDQLRNLLQESGWTDSKITGLFGGIDGVSDPFKERELTETQLKELAKKLESLKTKYEQRLILNQFALGTLIDQIGVTYSFSNTNELSKAIEEQGVQYPRDYLQQPGSSFVSSFSTPRHLTKERFDALIIELKKISGATTTDNAKRGELIRAAFGNTQKPLSQSTEADGITLVKGRDEMKEAANKLQELDMKNIETFLKFSNVILDRITGADRITVQSIRGSELLSKITAAGFTYRFTQKGLEVQATDPARAQKASEITLAFDTLIKTGTLTLDELKQGLLYTTPSFGAYAQSSRLSDGTPNAGAKMQDYVTFLQKKPQAELTKEEQVVLSSAGSMSALKMPELIRSYQNLGQMGSELARDPELAKQVQKVAESAKSGTLPTHDTPPGKIQSGANTVAEKASDLVGKTAENIGDFTNGTLKAIGKAFDKSAVGGTVVAILAIFAGWKFLTGDWGVGKMKAPGWVLALVAAGGAAAVEMARNMGYDVGGEIGKATDKAREKIKKTSESGTKGGSDDATAEPDKPENTHEKPVDTTNPTPSQKMATEVVEKNTDITSTLNGKSPALPEYIAFVHKELASIPMAKMITDDATSIFSPSPTLHADIKAKIGNLNPISLKKVLRAYLGADVRFTTTGVTEPGKKEQEAFLKRLGEKGLNVDEYKKSKTLAELTSALYSMTEKPKETPKLSEEARKKVLAYELVYNNEVKSKENFAITFADTPDEDGDFKITLTPKDPKKINPKADKIDPIEIYFDKDGNLRSEEISINGCAVILGQEIPGSEICSLKQDTNKIIITKK